MSVLVDALLLQIRAAKLPKPETELKFHPARRFRFDISWPKYMLAVEVDGGVWTGGRHSRGKGMVADMTKKNLAVLMGWRVLSVTNTHIMSGEALRWIEEALGMEKSA